MTIRFTVPGPPVPKGRPRIGKGGRAYTPAKTRAAEAQVAWLCKAAMKGRKPIPGPVAVTAHFSFDNKRRVDIDNCLKLILDSCNGIAYDDDYQVVEVRATKDVSDDPRTEVRIGVAYQ